MSLTKGHVATYLENHISVTATGRVSPSRRLTAGGADFSVNAQNQLEIYFNRIDKGAKVVIIYEFEGGPDTDYPDTVVRDENLTPANDPANDPVGGGGPTPETNESLTDEVSAFTVGIYNS